MEVTAIVTTMFPIAALSLDKRPEALLRKIPPMAKKASTKYPIVPVMTAPGIMDAMVDVFLSDVYSRNGSGRRCT